VLIGRRHQFYVPIGDEVLGLAAATEAEFFKLVEDVGGEVVVQDGRLHVIGRQSAVSKSWRATTSSPAGRTDRRGSNWSSCPGSPRALGRGTDTAGRVLEVTGPLEGGDDEGLAAVGLLAAVKQVQGLDDPARRLMIGQGDRLVVEPCFGLVAA